MKIKRLIIAGVVATGLAGGAFAFANSLTVTSTTLASGSTTVLPCGDSVAADYTTAYEPAITGYKVTTVTLSGVTALCASKSAKLELTGPTAGTALAASGPVILATGANAFAITGNIDAKDVTGLSVVITG